MTENIEKLEKQVKELSQLVDTQSIAIRLLLKEFNAWRGVFCDLGSGESQHIPVTLQDIADEGERVFERYFTNAALDA